MNQATADRLGELSENLDKFLELHPDDQEWIFPLLGKPEQRTILILQAIQGRYLTYNEIANYVGCHPSTIKTTLYALQDKGYSSLEQDKTGKWTTPKGGRYRALKKIGESKNETIVS